MREVTAAGRGQTRPARRGLAWVLAGLGCVALPGCRGDGTTPVLHTAAAPSPDTASPQPADVGEAPADEPAAPQRALWFASGPGREAILARERRDHEAARAHLDALLASPELSADARGAAELLRALEHLELGEHGEAADRFAAAAKAPGLAPIELRLRLWEAQARLDAGQPDRARALVDEVDPAVWTASAVGGDARIIEAHARQRTDDPAGAEAAYRAYLREHPSGARRFEARLELARLLAARDDPAARREARDLYDELRRGVPLSDYADEAETALAALERDVGPVRTGADARAHERELALLQAEAMLDRHRYASAVKAVDALVARGKLAAEQRCRAWYVKGSAIFKQRRRADARVPFERAAAECDKAIAATKDPKAERTLEDLRVKSRYQAARGLYADGKHARAAQAFEAIAADHRDHSYADDALVLAGESWESHGDPDEAAAAYRRALEERPGDMQHEARRRLLVMRFAAGADADALALCDAALASPIDHPVERAKLLYFRGRALDRLGRAEDAVAAWLEALDVAPLDYPALQALSRLRERGLLAQGLARLEAAREADAPGSRDRTGDAADAVARQRAEVLARLGLGEQARDELRHAGIGGWPSIAVLDQAGLYPAAQLELANLGLRWRSTPPGEHNRRRWEQAHPRPFFEVIGPGEPEHQVPALLTYAIMQTESRFDPGVTSFAGARGLVQLMPATARGLAKGAGVRLDGDAALFDPALNLDLGMRYLGRLTARYRSEAEAQRLGDGPVALAIPSYNAGAGAVDRWLDERGTWELDLFIEAIPYDETRKYTQSVLGRWLAYRWLYGKGEPEARLPYLPLVTPRKG